MYCLLQCTLQLLPQLQPCRLSCLAASRALHLQQARQFGVGIEPLANAGPLTHLFGPLHSCCPRSGSRPKHVWGYPFSLLLITVLPVRFTSCLQWQQAKSFFVDNFLEHAKAEGLEDCCWLHLVKESR